MDEKCGMAGRIFRVASRCLGRGRVDGGLAGCWYFMLLDCRVGLFQIGWV